MAQKKPFGRSLSDFGELKPGERLLLKACRMGNMALLGNSVPDSPTDENCVRAEFMRFLILGGDEQAPVHERGVQLQGAYVEDSVDLDGCHIAADVRLLHCQFCQDIYAIGARVEGAFDLEGSHLAKGLGADRLQCSSGVFLRNGFKATGRVRLLGARIDGDLSCCGGQFEVNEGAALLADGARVAGRVLLTRGFKAKGSVSLIGAQIGGDLICEGAQVEVRMAEAFLADGVDVKGDLILNSGFKAIGEVCLRDAMVGGCLNCSGGRFVATEGNAFTADRVNVRGDVFLNEGFKATGQVRLIGAVIGINLSCNAGRFEVEKGASLLISNTHIKGSVQLQQGFKSVGEVRLNAAKIGGSLSCQGGQFEGKDGVALSCVRMSINGSVFLDNHFTAIGEVRLLSAQIDGSLFCSGGQFNVKDGYALTLETSVVRGVWHLCDFKQPVRINAVHADVAVLVDDLNAWGDGSLLDGFCYVALAGVASTNGGERLNWLRKQPEYQLSEKDFRPQPWRHLQRVLRELGHTEDAKQVGIAFEDQLRKIGRMGQWPNDPCDLLRGFKGMVTRTAHYIFGKLAGYGYRPVDLVMWMLAVWLFCGGIYWALARSPFNAMAPSDPLIFQDARYSECRPTLDKQSDFVDKQKILNAPTTGNWPFCSDMPGEYSTFSPLAYSLDLLLPVVDLGQEKSWGSYIPSPDETAAEESVLHWRWGYLVRAVAWFETLFGWVSSLLLVAIISGFSRRNDQE